MLSEAWLSWRGVEDTLEDTHFLLPKKRKKRERETYIQTDTHTHTQAAKQKNNRTCRQTGRQRRKRKRNSKKNGTKVEERGELRESDWLVRRGRGGRGRRRRRRKRKIDGRESCSPWQVTRIGRTMMTGADCEPDVGDTFWLREKHAW